MSQRLARYNRNYSASCCRQQYYSSGVASTENVLATVSGDGHEVAHNFAKNNDNISKLHNYKILQQQITGHTIPSAEDIEKWLRYMSDYISNTDLSSKGNSQTGLEKSPNEPLSKVFDKKLLTHIELAAKKLNIDYDVILTVLLNDKVVTVNKKNNQVALPDLRLDNFFFTQEIPPNTDFQSQLSNTSLSSKDLKDKLQQNICNNKEYVTIAQLQNRTNSLNKNQQSKTSKTDFVNNVNGNAFDITLTSSIQGLSIENNSSDASCTLNSCTNVKNKHICVGASKSDNLSPIVVTQKEPIKYNTRSKSTNCTNVNSKRKPTVIKRKRKVTNQDNTNKTKKNNTLSIKKVLHKKPSSLKQRNENSKIFRNKSESSEKKPDNLQKVKNPSFYTNQELVISEALEKVGITESVLEYFYTPEKIKVWRCHLSECRRHFAKLCYLKFHLMAHLNVKPFKCDFPKCSWAFNSEFKLKRHKETHLKKKDYVCLISGCKRRFTTIYNLASHEKLHSRPNKIVCQVSDCSAMFQTKRALESHMKCHDESFAPYVCNYEGCGKRFYGSNALLSHQRCHSYSESDLTCSWPGCGKTFDQPCRKKEHMRSHTGQKPYACTITGCGWAFSTSSKLNRHQKKHTNDRKFVCDKDDCKKAFIRSEHLKEHKLTHTRDRIFQCHHCSAAFAAKSSLYVHLKNHANKDYVHRPQKKRNEEEKTLLKSNRTKKTSTGSLESESMTDEAENDSLTPNSIDTPTENVIMQKMYKCPNESCLKWYLHQSSLRIHMRKHTSPLSEIQNGNETTTTLLALTKPNKGSARTEYTCEYVLSMKPSRPVYISNNVDTVEMSESFLSNEDLPSLYCLEDVDLPAYQILLLDDDPIDGMQALD